MQYELYQFARRRQMNQRLTLETHILFFAQVFMGYKTLLFLLSKTRMNLVKPFVSQ